MEDTDQYISKCGRYKLEIVQDDYSESPDEWGNTDIFLVYDHRDFVIERDGFDPNDIYDYLYEKSQLKEFLKDKDVNNLNEQDEEIYEEFKYGLNDYFDYSSAYYIYPVAAHIHSGVSLSLKDSSKKKSWDTNISGFVLVKKEIVKPDYESSLTWDSEKLAEEYAESLINTWNTYLIGNVYGFRLYKGNKVIKILNDDLQDSMSRKEILNCSTIETEWEEIDSCWGFYGDDIKTNDILDHIPSDIEFNI